MEFLVVILVIGSIVAGFIALAYYLERKRAEALENQAREMGFEFYRSGDRNLQAGLAQLDLCSRGDARRLYNLMRGTAQNLEVSIFDYRYSTGSGKNRTTHTQTAICFAMNEGDLPAFSLKPEHIFHRIGGWFGYQDIDFASHPVFSKKFLLRGADEEGIRALFSDEVLSAFEEKKNISVEGLGNKLLYYQQGKKVKPQDINSLLEQGFEILEIFRSRAR